MIKWLHQLWKVGEWNERNVRIKQVETTRTPLKVSFEVCHHRNSQFIDSSCHDPLPGAVGRILRRFQSLLLLPLHRYFGDRMDLSATREKCLLDPLIGFSQSRSGPNERLSLFSLLARNSPLTCGGGILPSRICFFLLLLHNSWQSWCLGRSGGTTLERKRK